MRQSPRAAFDSSTINDRRQDDRAPPATPVLSGKSRRDFSCFLNNKESLKEPARTVPMIYEDRKAFTVPVTSGQYAPERIQLNSQNANVRSSSFNSVIAMSGEGLVAGMTVELWLLPVGLDPTNDANYFLFSAPGSGSWALPLYGAGWRGGQIRVKSGGTAGTATVSGVGSIG